MKNKKVSIDKIMPVTDVRANISRLVDEVQAGSTYVLTRSGKPAAILAPVKYLGLNKKEKELTLLDLHQK